MRDALRTGSYYKHTGDSSLCHAYVFVQHTQVLCTGEASRYTGFREKKRGRIQPFSWALAGRARVHFKGASAEKIKTNKKSNLSATIACIFQCDGQPWQPVRDEGGVGFSKKPN